MNKEITSNEFVRCQVEKMIAHHWAEAETAIIEALTKHSLNDLMLEIKWDGSFRVRVITAEERWLNWQSENHGGSAY